MVSFQLPRKQTTALKLGTSLQKRHTHACFRIGGILLFSLRKTKVWVRCSAVVRCLLECRLGSQVGYPNRLHLGKLRCVCVYIYIYIYTTCKLGERVCGVQKLRSLFSCFSQQENLNLVIAVLAPFCGRFGELAPCQPWMTGKCQVQQTFFFQGSFTAFALLQQGRAQSAKYLFRKPHTKWAKICTSSCIHGVPLSPNIRKPPGGHGAPRQQAAAQELLDSRRSGTGGSRKSVWPSDTLAHSGCLPF